MNKIKFLIILILILIPLVFCSCTKTNDVYKTSPTDAITTAPTTALQSTINIPSTPTPTPTININNEDIFENDFINFELLLKNLFNFESKEIVKVEYMIGNNITSTFKNEEFPEGIDILLGRIGNLSASCIETEDRQPLDDEIYELKFYKDNEYLFSILGYYDSTILYLTNGSKYYKAKLERREFFTLTCLFVEKTINYPQD